VTAQVEAVLADFRRWLSEQHPGVLAAAEHGAAPPVVDLHTVLGCFVALRQEVNLQTRSVRAQQEQNASAVQALQQAVEMLRQKEARGEQLAQQSQDEQLRPLLKTLVDLYDALALAGREISRAEAGFEPLLAELDRDAGLEEELPEPRPAQTAQTFWSRWFLSSGGEAALRASQEETRQAVELLRQERLRRRERQAQLREGCTRVRQMLGSLVSGYGMSLQRIERALRQHGLEPIRTVGAPFDPEQMEVLEAAAGSGAPAGEVIEEVRRGYLWKGRVFRFAQVRVARG
jgi:molecular chaperone GrpE